MPGTLISRTFEFDAGHRVWGHESKCAHLHGHRYKAEVYFTAPGLDKLGRVVDFGVLKSIIGTWIDDNWDHNMILHSEDALAELINPPSGVDPQELFGHELFASPGFFKEPFLMPFKMNPTAENLARVLYHVCIDLLAKRHPDVQVYAVKLWETPNCFALYPLVECGP